LPFFSPLYQKGNRLHVYAASATTALRRVRSQTMILLPGSFHETQADVAFSELSDRTFDVRTSSRVRAVNHLHRDGYR